MVEAFIVLGRGLSRGPRASSSSDSDAGSVRSGMGQESKQPEETELGDDRGASLTPTPAALGEMEPPAPRCRCALTAARAELPLLLTERGTLRESLPVLGLLSPPEPCRDREQLCGTAQLIPAGPYLPSAPAKPSARPLSAFPAQTLFPQRD